MKAPFHYYKEGPPYEWRSVGAICSLGYNAYGRFSDRSSCRSAPSHQHTLVPTVHLQFPRHGISLNTARIDQFMTERNCSRQTALLIASTLSQEIKVQLRARLDASIPSTFSGQRGCEPRFLDMAPLI